MSDIKFSPAEEANGEILLDDLAKDIKCETLRQCPECLRIVDAEWCSKSPWHPGIQVATQLVDFVPVNQLSAALEKIQRTASSDNGFIVGNKLRQLAEHLANSKEGS